MKLIRIGLMSSSKEPENNADGTTFDPIEVNEENADKPKNTFQFKKSLIAEVQKHCILYDAKHKNFKNMAEKEKAWLQIETALTTEVNVCRNTWIDLRYDYQRYARRLCKFLNCRNRNKKRRTAMAMETEMIFLWRFVANKSLYPLPADIESNEDNENATNVITADTAQRAADATEDEDVVILENDPVVVIDLDNHDNDNAKPAHNNILITKEIRRLVGLIEAYPELYNSKHHYYNDLKRKGIIWNSIANETGDVVSKLMKCWLHMQTQYEWELNNLQQHKAGKTELQNLLDFLSSHIQNNPNTVYKHAFYLKKSWQEPMENSENVYLFLEVMKEFPQILNLTEEMIHIETKNEQYFQLWHQIADLRDTTIGICETTWLIMRSWFLELKSIRKHRYQLKDKWYFESMIGKLYKQATKLKLPPANKPIPETSIDLNLENRVQSLRRIKANPFNEPISTTSIDLNLENLIKSSRIKTNHFSGAFTLAPVQCNVIKTYSGTGLKSATIPSLTTAAAAAFNDGQALSLNTLSPSSISLNRNKITEKLPYQLPLHTKVTAFTPSATATVTTAKNYTIKSERESTFSPNSAIVGEAQIPARPVRTGKSTYRAILPKRLNTVNPKAISIDLVEMQKHKQLVVKSLTLSEKCSMSMNKTALFIREVMAIPTLHNKLCNELPEVNVHWHYISTRFNLSVHICKAIWNFLRGNFDKLPQIAPLDDLMRPFKTKTQFWKKDCGLFTTFHERAIASGFQYYKPELPELMQKIGSFFQVIQQEREQVPYSEIDACLTLHWDEIHTVFPCMYSYKISELWQSFKKVFWDYMTELECGIDNKWHPEWWQALEKMQFLMELRYHNQEPFYYIVRNKIIEEIDRCNRDAIM